MKTKRTQTGNKRGELQRKRILRALHSCVIQKGYANTTLTEVAETAGTYPSHLLYYFDGKEAILEEYFQNTADNLIERLESFRGHSPKRQFDLLTNLYFNGEGSTKSEIGFMLECFGVAVNNPRIRQAKSEMDEKHKTYLKELFERTPSSPVSDARESAILAYASLVGLRAAIYFDESLKLADARRLFHSRMLSIAGLTEPA